MIFAKEPFLLHLLAGSDTMTALDAAKSLLDAGTHDANELEPTDNLSALHVAAAWDNLAMCQLLIHYGANVDAQDIDKRRPLDVATGECRRFLKRLRQKSRRERNRLRRLISYLYRGICTRPAEANQSIVLCTPAELKAQKRRSCPAEIQLLKMRTAPSLPRTVIAPQKRMITADRPQPAQPAPSHRPQAVLPPTTTPQLVQDPPRSIPSAPRRSSSVAREEFLTSDNTGEDEIQIDCGPFASEDEEERRKQAEKEDQLRQQFAQLKLDDLKTRLRRRNCPIGPMDGRNRKIYEAKLAKMEAVVQGKEVKQSRNPESIGQYSPALQKWVLKEERGEQEANSQTGQREELQVRNEFTPSSAKNEVSFFCYLLIDPTQLPSSTASVPFRHFLASIFYVGKGKRSRPLQHLIHASRCHRFAQSKPAERSEKLKRILELWERGEGVISLHIFYNVHSAEAFVREGAMIDAIGVDNLTNVQRGSFPGVASKWSRQQIAEFGALLLHKAHAIFQNERCRPIFEADVAGLNEH